VISIKFTTAGVILFLVVLIPAAFAQEDGSQAATAPKTRRIFTNDSLNGSPTQSADGWPPISGLTQCGKDLKCFLPSLDKAMPAVLTRTETVKEGTAVTSSAWSLVSLGPASDFGKNCSGSMFDAPQSPRANGNK